MDKVVHFEIPADDTARAKKFYEKAFGWGVESYQEFDYHGLITVKRDEKTRMPKEPGAINGGMMKRQGPIKSPVITISVKDMNKAMENVKEAGGKIVRDKMNVGEMGIAAYFQDSEGNVLGLWQELKK